MADLKREAANANRLPWATGQLSMPSGESSEPFLYGPALDVIRKVAGALDVPTDYVLFPFLSLLGACLSPSTRVEALGGFAWREPAILWSVMTVHGVMNKLASCRFFLELASDLYQLEEHAKNQGIGINPFAVVSDAFDARRLDHVFRNNGGNAYFCFHEFRCMFDSFRSKPQAQHSAAINVSYPSSNLEASDIHRLVTLWSGGQWDSIWVAPEDGYGPQDEGQGRVFPEPLGETSLGVSGYMNLDNIRGLLSDKIAVRDGLSACFLILPHSPKRMRSEADDYGSAEIEGRRFLLEVLRVARWIGMRRKRSFSLSMEAQGEFERIHNQLADLCNDENTPEPTHHLFGRCCSQTLRLALLFHLFDKISLKVLSSDYMNGISLVGPAVDGVPTYPSVDVANSIYPFSKESLQALENGIGSRVEAKYLKRAYSYAETSLSHQLSIIGIPLFGQMYQSQLAQQAVMQQASQSGIPVGLPHSVGMGHWIMGSQLSPSVSQDPQLMAGANQVAKVGTGSRSARARLPQEVASLRRIMLETPAIVKQSFLTDKHILMASVVPRVMNVLVQKGIVTPVSNSVDGREMHRKRGRPPGPRWRKCDLQEGTHDEQIQFLLSLHISLDKYRATLMNVDSVPVRPVATAPPVPSAVPGLSAENA